MKYILKVTTITTLLLATLSTAMANEQLSSEKPGNIENGAQVWADTCMRCHNLRAPSDLSKRAWPYSMYHMRVRAGLTGQETRDILAFILASKTGNDRE